MATTLEILEAERRRALEGAAAKEAAAKEAAAAAAAESARAEKIARVMADLQELGLSLAAPIEPQAVVPESTGMTIGRLTDEYEVHPDSGFQTLRHRTRGNYRSNMRRLKKDAGHLKLGQMTAADFQNLHDSWLSRGKTIPHSLITQLRLEVSFGVDVLKDRDCERAALVLHKMQFASPEYEKGRPLTPKEARSFRKHARAEGRASLALGQAFQMDCGLKQKDVVGEWTPLSEQQIRPTATIDHKRKQKWHWGLCWEEIDEALVLRHVTSMTKELVVKDLKTAQMVKEELEAKYGAPLSRAKLPATGPVIIDEDTEFPYLAHKYRQIWREFARARGVPDNVRNMHSHKGESAEERHDVSRRAQG